MKMSKEELLSLAEVFADESGTCLLYSGGDYDSSQKSFLFLFPIETITIEVCDDPWGELKHSLGEFNHHQWVGYLAYELGAYSDPDVRIPHETPTIPLACFQRYGLTLIVDHATDEVSIHSNEGSTPVKVSKKQISITAVPLQTQEEYCKKVREAQEWILDGEIYQVNLSQKLQIPGKNHPFSLFKNLCVNNPAPFSAYLKLNDFTIVSSSPERFLKKKGKELETRPIKGTAPRGKTPQEDILNKEQLLSSEKEKAELLMITDLMRNDLGKVSVIGSVKTEKIWEVEEYANVFHMHSKIKSIAVPEVDPVDILRACFPGGSITGCPKLRSMEAIHHFEQRPRGIYTGSIGYICGNGDFDFNIAIRTLLCTEDGVEVQLGGAIVSDSIPEKEYEETLHKGESIFNALGINNNG